MGLYHPEKFETAPWSQSWDILFTSLVTEKKNEKKKRKHLPANQEHLQRVLNIRNAFETLATSFEYLQRVWNI